MIHTEYQKEIARNELIKLMTPSMENPSQSEQNHVRKDVAEECNRIIKPGTFKCSVFVRLVDTIGYKRYLSDPQRYPNPYPELTKSKYQE